MVSEVNTKEILKRLESIQSELDYIKKHMIDKDEILTPEERTSLAEAEAEYENGETTSLDDLKGELDKK